MENELISKEDVDEMMKYDDINQENVVEKYDAIATTYDHTVNDICGYPDPAKITEAILKYEIPKDAPIIDLGCGTGLVGECLSKEGYTNVVGIDASPEMLKEAEGRGYKELKQGFLCKDELPEDIAGKFVVATSSGLMSHFLSPEVLIDHLKCLKPKESEDDKRYIIFATREEFMEKFGYKEKLKELEEEGTYKFIEKFTWTRYEKLLSVGGVVGTFKTLEACCYVYSV